MASGEQTVKVKFTGNTTDLDRASRKAQKDVDKATKGMLASFAGLATQIPDVLGKAVGAIPPMGQLLAGVLAAGLAVSLAPLLAAAISSAVLLALGGGVLALGIMSAIDNPKVTKAFDGLKKKATKLFDDFGKPFVEPLVRAAKTFSKLIDQLRPQVVQLGKIIAPVIDKLAPALAGFFKSMMPGITAAVKASVPLFEVLAEKLPGIGQAIGIFFEEISKNGADTTLFFSDLLDAITKLIVGIGVAIGWLTKFYSNIRQGLIDARNSFLQFTVYALNQIGRLLDGATKALGWIPGLGPKLQAAQSEFRKFQENANRELNKVRDRSIKITVWSNVGEVAARVGSILAGLKGVKIGARASGGPVQGGRSYLVGERGPEILTMGANGYVTPNHKLGSGGGSGETVYEITLNIADGISQVFRIRDRDLKRRLSAK